ncbi:staphylopine family metallophore export MFS transporter CntE [Ureibacillus sinduriensis]|uniref:Multidrug MFS transporter n=1 Tax=Ureibacillus sinduriensis BLB-1 = JCM 15800 TaxID=1384057 RepID=A0A0A3IQ58_9BACL|nr:MFS transporter [Ureibacillus sinduriensis]KGR76977.1 multidrug MFS transporter [Ureibacillus sinduriensis BLB-1 = JCM 15800]
MKGALSWTFIRLYILVLLYFSANSILNVIIPLQGEELGATNAMIGLIMGAYLFTTMFFRPWAGHIIHKYGPMKVLHIILIINGIALILYSITGLSGFFFARMMQGISTAFFSMALQIGIIDALPEEERSQGISLYSLFSYIPGIIGPLLALGVWQHGMNLFTIVMVTIAILTGVVGYSTKIESAKVAYSKKAPQSTNIFWSFHQLVKNPILFRCSILMLVSSVIFGAITTFIPLYAKQIDNGSAGIYLMLQAAVVVLTRLTFMKRIPSDGKWHNGFIVSAMLILTIASYSVSYASVAGFTFFYFGAILMGVAQALIYPTLTTYLSFVLEEDNRNVLLGLFIAMADLGVSLGSVLMGPIADASSYSFMYSICAIWGLVLIFFSYRKKGII